MYPSEEVKPGSAMLRLPGDPSLAAGLGDHVSMSAKDPWDRATIWQIDF